MVSKFLDPKNDIAFKKIFGTEKHKGILIHFINDMLRFKNQEPIIDVVFLKTNRDPEIAVHKTINELKSIEEKWMYFFKHAEETTAADLEKIIGEDLVFKEAYIALDRFSWDEEELRTYDQWEKYEGSYIASMDQKYDEGMAKGEAKATLVMAKKMLKIGVSLENVAEASGLTLQEVKSLQETIK